MNQVVVAPRELVDLVYRCNRLAGVDPGHAALWAQTIVEHTATAIETLTAAVDQIVAGEPARPDADACFDRAAWATAERDGLPIPVPTFDALNRHASAFLVAEHVLDHADVPTT